MASSMRAVLCPLRHVPASHHVWPFVTLGVVQRTVGHADHSGRGPRVQAGEPGSGAAHDLQAGFDLDRFAHVPQRLAQEDFDPRNVGAWEDDGELVAADPEDCSVINNRTLQPVSDRHKNLVTDLNDHARR